MPKSKFKQAGLGKCSEVLLPPTMTADDHPERCCPSKTLAFCPQAGNGPGASGLVSGLVTWRPLCCQIGHDMIVFCPPCLPKRSRHGWSVLTRHVKGRQSFAPGPGFKSNFLALCQGWVLQLERKNSAANAHFKKSNIRLGASNRQSAHRRVRQCRKEDRECDKTCRPDLDLELSPSLSLSLSCPCATLHPSRRHDLITTTSDRPDPSAHFGSCPVQVPLRVAAYSTPDTCLLASLCIAAPVFPR